MTRRAATLAAVLAAATSACGDQEERAPGPSRAEIHALVAEGLGALGLRAPRSVPRFRLAGPTLRIQLAPPAVRGALGGLLESFDGARVEVEQFCPKPALLRCRLAFRAWAVPRSSAAVQRAAVALRRLAAQTYDARPLIRRGRRTARVITANGELLAAVGSAGQEVTLSFGGLDPPRRPGKPAASRLEVGAGPETLTVMRRDLSPPARRALTGVRRLVVSLRL